MTPKQHNQSATAITLALVLLIIPCIQPVQAEDTEVASLRTQVQELQRMVIDLQQQVQELQARVPSRPATETPARAETPVTNKTSQIRGYVRPDLVSTSPSSTPVRSTALSTEAIMENWHTLERGMSNDKVSRLLGAPTRSFRLNNKLVWYYDYAGIGKGSVMFSQQGQVTDWQAPPRSHWFW